MFVLLYNYYWLLGDCGTASEFTFTIDLSTWLPPLPFDLQVDNIVIDDWALIGRLVFPDSAYEWPAPALEIIGDMTESSYEPGGIKATHSPFPWVQGIIFTVNHSHEGVFFAVPRMMARPIDFRWCLAGHPIAGDGTLMVDGTEVRYSVDGDRCELSVGMGGSVETELCVTAIDGRGVELFASKAISVQGETSHGGLIGEELADPSVLYMGPPALIEREPSPAEGMTTDAYVSMISSAFKIGMGVDPWHGRGIEEP